jgi:hypothetical protein
MDTDALDLEARLRQRYTQLVEAHCAPSSPIAAGLRALPTGQSAFAATQAAWRFYANEQVTLRKLFVPLITHVAEQLAQQLTNLSGSGSSGLDCYTLIAHDWCWLQYSGHASKKDRLAPVHEKACGYELSTALALSSVNGAPLGPIHLELTCIDKVYTSRTDQPLNRCVENTADVTRRPDPAEHLASLEAEIEHVEQLAQMTFKRPLVHIVDREADSVALYRSLLTGPEGRRLLVIRARERQRVVHAGRTCLLSDIADDITKSAKWAYCQPVRYHGRYANQFVAETTVTITRPASNGSHKSSGRKPIPGPPVSLRLVLSEVRSEAGVVLSRWYLYTSLPSCVPGEQIANWYFWRWRIECFFKLLKSAGWNIEDWQQESAAAIAKRLAVVSMAAALVWQLQQAADQTEQAEQSGTHNSITNTGSDERDEKTKETLALCHELVRLSGRQMKRSRPITAPALLAGLWTLLSLNELLERYSPEQLRGLLDQLQHWRACKPPGFV